MQVSDRLNSLSAALQGAVMRDLPAVEVTYAGRTLRSRPQKHNVRVDMFLQEWPTTALGFDVSMAGQAATSAYTCVITHHNTACVCFGEDLAYVADRRNQNFIQDLRDRRLEEQAVAKTRYEAILPAHAMDCQPAVLEKEQCSATTAARTPQEAKQAGPAPISDIPPAWTRRQITRCSHSS